MKTRPHRPMSCQDNSSKPPLKTVLLTTIILFLAALFFLSAPAWATSASISVSGNEGPILLSASASFSTYENNNSGTLYVYQDGILMKWVSGNGSASWSTTLNGGSMTQGSHTFMATAVDSQGTSNSETAAINIDNTPVVTVNSPGQVEGAFDVTGTATFKENVGGGEGTVYVYVDGTGLGYQWGYQTFEGTSITWNLSEWRWGANPNAGSMSQGIHTIYVNAQATNGAWSEWAQGTFSIDNTPTVTVNSPGQVEGAFEITGTATFKENVGGGEGTVYVYVDGTGVGYQWGYQPFEGTSITWNLSEWRWGANPNAGSMSQGIHTIYVNAQATNGAWSEWAQNTFEVTSLQVAKNLGEGCGPCKTRTNAGNPINFGVGNKVQKETDLALQGPGLLLEFNRYYNSKSTRSDSLGYGWSGSFSERLSFATDKVILAQANGREVHFLSDGQGKYLSETDQVRVIEPVSGGYRLVEPEGKVLTFDSTGKLNLIADRNGNAQTLGYSSGRLSFVEDNFARRVDFAYNPEGRLSTLTSPAGQFTYAYDSQGNLASATNPALKTKTYLYEDSNDSHNLTGIIDEKGIRSGTYAYDAEDRAIRSEGPGGNKRIEVGYEDNYVRRVTDSLGRTTTFMLFVANGIGRVKSATGSGCGSCLGNLGEEYALSKRLYVDKETDARGTVTLYTYDDRGNVLTKKEAAGTLYERITSYTYHPDYNLIASITTESTANPGQVAVTTFTYDGNGNLIARTETGYSAADPVSRTTAVTYNTFGQVTRMDGPRTDISDITSFEYYPNDPTQELNRGMLRRIVDALGHETLFGQYNAFGKPGEIRDANSSTTTLTYDVIGRLTARSVAGNPTLFEYDDVGNLIRTTLPNGRTISNTYTPSGLLARIEDNAGNFIIYSYDGEGNRIREEVYDSTGVLKRFVNFEYDDHNRLKKVFYPGGSFEERGYDPNGNLIRVQDPNNLVTVYNYDDFNRLSTVLDPTNGTTRYAYNGHDNLISVTDAENHTTTYAYDDLGNLMTTVSPDTNTTRYTYDSTGNITSKTDANGITTTYTYDSLSRLTGIRFPVSTQDITYTYDSGTNGTGRLTNMTDPAGTTSYTYDQLGDLETEARTFGGVDYLTRYEYDPAGVLAAMTYPSGRILTYELDAAARIRKVTSTKDSITQTLADNIDYLPFGPLQGLTYGNSISQTRTFDERYRLSSLVSGSLQSLDYTVDPAGNITGIRDNVDGSKTQTFTYDSLYRLTGATGAYGTLGYTYDKVGNRLSETTNGQTETYSYIHGTNKLSQITGTEPISLTYDANGNTTAMGSKTFIYSQNNRLIRASENGLNVGEYTYNGQGQRAKKVSGGKTTIFIYDMDGHLVSEYDGQGNILKEYVFFEGSPLAQFAYEAKQDVDVTVSTSKGRALSGINVYAFREAGTYTGVRGVTSDQGVAAFRKTDLADGYYKFRVDYLSYQFWSELVHLPETNDVQMLIDEETAEISVSVAGGAREGIEVYLFNEAGTYLGLYGVTDADGKVQFDLPVGRSFKFRADYLSSQYWSDPVVIGSGGTTSAGLDTGGGQLVLTLEEEPGAPLQGIKTYLFSASGAYLGLTDTSDGNGRVYYGVPGATYKVRADYLGYQFWSDSITAKSSTASTLTIPHQDVVINVEGDCSADVQPRVDLKAYLFTPSGSYLGIYDVTDEKGEALYHLPNKDYKVRADYLGKQYWSEVFSWTDKTITINEGTADTTVTNMGQPVQGVPVYVFTTSGTYLGLSGTTDSQGNLSFSLPEGQYNFRADYMESQYWSGNSTLIPHVSNPITISTGGGSFALRVQKGSGAALSGVTCYLFSESGAYLGKQGVTNSDGEVSFNLADGTYNIRMDYLGYQFWTSVFTVPGTLFLSHTIPHQDVTITVAGEYAPDTAPIQGLEVHLFTPSGSFLNQSRTTDPNGKVVFNLPEKDYKVRLDYLSTQYWSSVFNWEDVSVTIHEAVAEVHVLQADTPLPGVNVYVFSSSGTYLSISAKTDADGVVSWLLPEDTYKFRADYQGKQFWATQEILADEVNAVNVDTGGGTFTLKVEKSPGTPLTSIPVYVFTPGGSYLGISGQTNAQGELSFTLSSGAYRFRVDYLGYQFWGDAIDVPSTLSDVMTIPHQDTMVTVNRVYGSERTPLQNTRVYLFTESGSYLSRYGDTDGNGQVVFSLPQKNYKVRADLMSSQYWSEAFNWRDMEVEIAHGKVNVHVPDNGEDVVDAPVYLFTPAGSYLGKSQRTDTSGHAAFDIPAKAYKLRVDYNGKQYWSDVVNVIAHEETLVDMPLDQLAMIPTNSPKPSRYDGEPLEYNPEPIRLATMGSLLGILSQATIASSPSPNVYYYLNDHLGTPQLLMDASGAVVWKATYKPFGAATTDPASALTTDFRFPGQYFDTETGLHYNYHRYYDSRTGRYLTPDPVGIEAGITLYHYVYSSPANFTDTFGLWTHHEELTRNAWAGAHIAIPYGAIILDTIVKYNKLVDKDLISENEWHFNRGLGQDRGEAIRAYQDLLSNQWGKIGAWLSNPNKSNCSAALKAFGQLTHVWQDYYAHAIPQNQNWNEPIGKISGSPESIPGGVIPSSWRGILRSGEHGWQEPGLRAIDFYQRQTSAVEFTAMKMQIFLPRFVCSCRCYFKEMFK